MRLPYIGILLVLMLSPSSPVCAADEVYRDIGTLEFQAISYQNSTYVMDLLGHAQFRIEITVLSSSNSSIAYWYTPAFTLVESNHSDVVDNKVTGILAPSHGIRDTHTISSDFVDTIQLFQYNFTLVDPQGQAEVMYRIVVDDYGENRSYLSDFLLTAATYVGIGLIAFLIFRYGRDTKESKNYSS